VLASGSGPASDATRGKKRVHDLLEETIASESWLQAEDPNEKIDGKEE